MRSEVLTEVNIKITAAWQLVAKVSEEPGAAMFTIEEVSQKEEW
jgi:hypothetical protein